VGDAWCVFYEIMPFLALDMGGVPRPEVAIVYSPLSRNKDVLQNIHSQLIRHHFDRCIISDRMVEEGCLKEADFKLIILPYVKVLSREALEEILDAQERGAKIWIVGEFALHDEYFRADEGYKRLRENVVKGAIVGGSLEMAVAKAGLEPIIAGELEDVIAYRKEHGVILLNRGMGRVVRVALPEWMRGEYVAVVSDVGQVREIRRAGKEMEVYLKDALGGDCVFVNAHELAGRLAQAHVFINPCGETFPREVWDEFIKFLRRGGGFVNLGGLPFNHPVRFEGGEWVLEVEQASLRKRVYINHGYEQRWQEVQVWKGEENFELPEGISFTGSFGFDVKLSQVADEERELGSSGRRDGRIRTLVAGYSRDGRRLASPIVGIDWLGG